MQRLCFVTMPYGHKKDHDGRVINFDMIFRDLIAPAVEAAELCALRADEEMVGGLFHKARFERLIYCPFALFDLTLANANVIYELGIRHATRRQGTIAMYAEGSRLPFDISPVRATPYQLNADKQLSNLESDRIRLIKNIQDVVQNGSESPVFQLLDLTDSMPVSYEKSEVFRERVAYTEITKSLLRKACSVGLESVEAVEKEIRRSDPTFEELGVIAELFIAYRDVKGWAQIDRLYHDLPVNVQKSSVIIEQWVLAINRLASAWAKRGMYEQAQQRRKTASETLELLIKERGASSDTCGILGRILKDQWFEAKQMQDFIGAHTYLRKAIAAYRAGFEADIRDPYTGTNLVTLMEIANDAGREKLVPVVRYAVERRMQARQDFWDYATCVELAVLGHNEFDAMDRLSDALSTNPYDWQKESLGSNLNMIAQVREARGEDALWIRSIIAALLTSAA